MRFGKSSIDCESLIIKGLVYSVLFGCLLLICILGIFDIKYALVFSILPLAFLAFGFLMSRLTVGFALLFVLNYVICGLARYVPLKVGMIMTVLSLGFFAFTLIKGYFSSFEWKRSRSLPVLLWGIWLVYCVMEVFNPNALTSPWMIAITTYAVFPFLAAVLLPLLFKKYSWFQWLLMVWAVLTGLAAIKGYWQRNRGFDSAELYWLYVDGGAVTHFIYSGVRYFSFFPDAANYGSGMAQSFVTFGIAFFYTKNIWAKLFFLGAAASGCYGMVISGTRSSLIIPVVGLVVYMMLCKKIIPIIVSALVMGCVVGVLKYTDAGRGNSLVDRMRTIFDVEDASLQVRMKNQELLGELMEGKPFGAGLGLGGGKAKRFLPDAPLSQIPTDSWMVMTWVETGIIGVVIYYGIFLILLGRAAFLAVFRFKGEEYKGVAYSLIAGIAGILVSSYGNEVLSYPNGFVVFCGLSGVYLLGWFDKENQEKKKSLTEDLNSL